MLKLIDPSLRCGSCLSQEPEEALQDESGSDLKTMLEQELESGVRDELEAEVLEHV